MRKSAEKSSARRARKVPLSDAERDRLFGSSEWMQAKRAMDDAGREVEKYAHSWSEAFAAVQQRCREIDDLKQVVGSCNLALQLIAAFSEKTDPLLIAYIARMAISPVVPAGWKKPA